MDIQYFYHGTNLKSALSIQERIDLSMSQESVDFGRGFYVTKNKERAMMWAKRKARVKRDEPALVYVQIDLEAAKPLIKVFNDDLDWGRFVINNRNGYDYVNKVDFKEHNLDAKYDITYGRIADIDVVDVADMLNEEGKMLYSLDRIKNLSYPMQYAFHTERSLSYVKVVQVERLGGAE